MRLSSPSFWYPAPNEKSAILATLLAPLSWLYRLGHIINYGRQAPFTFKSEMPVICVGNINIGGTGKTPSAIAIMDIVSKIETIKNPCFLSRGYGGIVSKPSHIDLTLFDHIDIGDEAVMLARKAQTIVSRDRPKGALKAQSYDIDCLIMDDGMQNNSLHKDITFCVIDGAHGFGNGKTIPAGPLRETLKAGFKKSDAFILIGADKHNLAAQLPDDKPVFKAALNVTKKPDAKKSYTAFAGIGHPEKFKATLESLGLDITSWHPFPDHHDFKESELKTLAEKARDTKSALITTEKDIVRLPEDFIEGNNVIALPVALKWKKPKDIEAFLREKLSAVKQKSAR